jgi:hypothetical protein
MIKVRQKVEEIIKRDHEAIFCLSRGILNLSSYARQIHTKVEGSTKKQVKISTIVMALSRLGRELKEEKPLIQDVVIDGITVKTPLVELVFEKTSKTVERLSLLEKTIKPKNDEWFSFSQNTRAVIIICSQSKEKDVLKHMKDKPVLHLSDLSAIGLAINEKYHPKPNITFSLIHRIAERKIPLAETISTWSEIIFIFKSEYLNQILEIFKTK